MNFPMPFQADVGKPDPHNCTESLAWSPLIHQHERCAIFPAKSRLTSVPASAVRADLAALGRDPGSLGRGAVDGGRDKIVAVGGTRLDAWIVAAAASGAQPSRRCGSRTWNRRVGRAHQAVSIVG